jgi:hypothetical protein
MDDAPLHRCPQHPDRDAVFVLTPDLIHYGKFVCPACGRLLSWAKKPDNEGKRRRPPQDHLHWVFEEAGIDYCQMCMRSRRELPHGTVLDVHHIVEVQDGGDHERSNLMLLCNVCHRIVHLLRLYRSAPEELSVAIAPGVKDA